MGGTGEYHHYASDTILLPQTTPQSNMYGFDLDGDPGGEPDNALGRILSVLASNGLDSEAGLATRLMEGTIVVLHSVQADSLQDDPSATWQIYMGDATASPDYSGNGIVTVASSGSMETVFSGAITGGRMEAAEDFLKMKMEIAAGQPAVEVNFVGARLEAEVTESGCSGKLGGGLTVADLEMTVIPIVVDSTNAQIAMDCPGGQCMLDSIGGQILNLFDDPMRMDDLGVITAEELKDSDLLGLLLRPDVDLLDASGAYMPRTDGENDAISIGLSFTCVGATFTAPGE